MNTSALTSAEFKQLTDQAIAKWALNLHPFRPSPSLPSSQNETGAALKEIRDKELYRGTHNNFYLYCAERWGLRPDRVNWYISLSEANFLDKADFLDNGTGKDEICKKDEYVYFLAHKDLVKIGYSADIKHRVRSIQTMSPVPLTLLGFIPGDKRIEQNIHRRFAHLWSHGEWFKLTPELNQFIKRMLPDGK